MEKEKVKGGDAFGDMVGGDEGERKKVNSSERQLERRRRSEYRKDQRAVVH